MNNYLEYLRHIKDECEYLIDKSKGLTIEKFVDDETLKRAFVRSIEIIGEAAKKIPEDFRQKYHNVNWREMTGMRDVLIHDYLGIDYYIVWDVVVNHIPPLLEKNKRNHKIWKMKTLVRNSDDSLDYHLSYISCNCSSYRYESFLDTCYKPV